ncbi:uncharacterized protein LOC127797565 [Diospyros lotus]|uniref:uncharacterized protein LOC127797565 n=1 Tax=Diospyros lotus TaxID=55363 RepID=UPI0022516D5D|nr:uncharacterized protein LOC127797565 [Diospyros lotus]
MARKGNQNKNGKGVSDSECVLPKMKVRGKVSLDNIVGGEELLKGNQPVMDDTVHENKRKQKKRKSLGKEKEGANQGVEQTKPGDCNSEVCIENLSASGSSSSKEENGGPSNSSNGPKYSRSSTFGLSFTGMHANATTGSSEFSDAVVIKHLRASALSIFKAASEWLERKKPLFFVLGANISDSAFYVQKRIQQAYPIVLKWLMHFGNIMLLLSMVWLDCALRGIDSFLRMGTTSFFLVIWCSILSVVAMIGMFKFVAVLVITALAGLFVGFTIVILLVGVCGIIFLWFCGSFWATTVVICSGGIAFMLRHERIALLITTLYSIYCVWTYVGWLGLLLALNLSFISSDALSFFLKNSMNEHRMPPQAPEQTTGMQGQPGFFYSDAGPASPEPGFVPTADRGPGVASTSGTDCEITPEDEVVRLLNCTDHYSILGLSRYENVDISILKREYRKKAMLVHPDKNMGNEKAAEAFKKLQNAYEVLLDSFKRKAYDDELRREELLNYFRRFQDASQKNRRHKFFAPGFTQTDTDGDDPLRESRRIACRKCGNFHIWIHTKKSKPSARWCQDCKDFHQAKDGDGWVEQSSQPFLFGMLQKVDAPRAYVCADSKIYDATEWYICQGMRCPANTHKPSFHVNTSLTSKHSNGKGSSSGHRGGAMPSSPNLEDNMTEEEFFEWLQNAVQAGMFDNFAGESPSSRAENSSKSGGGSSSSSSGSGSKRKKKGKKQW